MTLMLTLHMPYKLSIRARNNNMNNIILELLLVGDPTENWNL